MSDDLAAFLLARLDEDEQVARAATPGLWSWDMDGGAFDGEPTPKPAEGAWEWGHHGPDLVAGPETEVITSWGYDTDNVIVKRGDAEHIARWDPARVLAEVKAKRRIVKAWPDPFGNWPAEQAAAARSVKEQMLRALAEPYAGHPDYRPEWAPR